MRSTGSFGLGSGGKRPSPICAGGAASVARPGTGASTASRRAGRAGRAGHATAPPSPHRAAYGALARAEYGGRDPPACRAGHATAPPSPHRRVLERVLRAYGRPRAIRTDNGPPFASLGLGGADALGGVVDQARQHPERIAPGHPEQHGRLERRHRTLKAETTVPPKPSHRSQQRAGPAFRPGYHDQRPHEALGQRPPGRLYRPAYRASPRRIRSPEYGRGVTVRKVRTNGQIR